MGVSIEELAERAEIYVDISKAEVEPDFLETNNLDYNECLSKGHGVPMQVLLAIRCGKCGRYGDQRFVSTVGPPGRGLISPRLLRVP